MNSARRYVVAWSGGEVALVLQPLFSLRDVGPIPAMPPAIAAIPAGLQSDLDRAA